MIRKDLYFIFFTMISVIATNSSDFHAPRRKEFAHLRNTTIYSTMEILHNEEETTFQTNFEKNREEDAEFLKLKLRWSALTNMHEGNQTQSLIPSDWLWPTAQHNLTFPSTLVKNTQTQKIVDYIATHHIQQNVRYKGSFVKQRLLGQDKLPGLATLGSKILGKTNKNASKNLETTNADYPGKNQTIRNELIEQWNMYYQCLENHQKFVPEAHYVFPGESIQMFCPTCSRPGDETKIVWTVATLRTRHRQEDIDPSQMKSAFSAINRMTISEGGTSLHIYGVNEKDSGNYTCRVLNTMLTAHLLQVADAAENLTRVWNDSSQERPHAAPAITLPNFGIRVFTKWKNWTSCSRCGRVGKRFQVGVCMIETTIDKAQTILALFKGGIPCRSRLLPKPIQEHPNVISRKSEIVEAFCKEPCQKEKYIFKNDKGQIIEEVDNSKGIYSMLQKLPKLPPSIRRKILFLKQWETAHILCPGSLLSDIPKHWFVDNQPIYSKGDRIYVTPSHTLVIEDLGLSDSKIYSCWQGSKLVGTVHLIISQPVRLTFSQQISTISMILIVSAFVIIFSRALCKSL